MTDSTTTRRARGKQQKQERIFAAAHDLFQERGYDSVTTAEIADRADISHGTLFRYAATKSELILMVGNEWFETALREGIDGVDPHDTVRDQLETLLAPIAGSPHPIENVATYQRNTIACTPHEPEAARAQTLVDRLVAEIAAILSRSRPEADPLDAGPAAQAVYAALHLAVIRADAGDGRLSEILHPQVDIIVRGYTSAAHERNET